ncbi:hypothetical protein BACCIP111899_03837 [Bacillus rhizoplanae]|uniref:Uncharacterized protein n=1 Tax=Bacillus rhizoplanae TaxID=2880966 RepID=A0ABM8YFX5_9BACI|nr:hypothetical protein [Bacillus rhizoplanae]CAG9614604.1 hypothetical protein BACCIP111899_03837 [Bacillus rhizoplanae]
MENMIANKQEEVEALENIASFDADVFLSETANRVSKVWRIVFCVDTLITLSYVIFPKKKKKEKETLPR